MGYRSWRLWWSSGRWRKINTLLGRLFKIVTDHHSLCSLKKMRDPKGKLGCWMLEMAKHQYDIIHKSGILHVDADALSRCPLQAGAEEPGQPMCMTVVMDEVDLWDSKSFRHEQAKDDHLAKVLKELKEPNCQGVISECYSGPIPCQINQCLPPHLLQFSLYFACK